MTAKARLTGAARFAVLMLVVLSMISCSALELYQGNASATTAAATENPTVSALESALAEVRATQQSLSDHATASAAPQALTPTTRPAADKLPAIPASAQISIYGSVPIDSDRLNIIAALAFDADGQLLAATRAGEIYALPDSDGDGAADMTRLIFADDEQALGQIAGMIVSGEALILLNDERLSLLRDSDGDGAYDSVTHLSEGLPADQSPLQASNGMVQAPDGRLFTVDVNTGEILRIVLRE